MCGIKKKKKVAIDERLQSIDAQIHEEGGGNSLNDKVDLLVPIAPQLPTIDSFHVDLPITSRSNYTLYEGVQLCLSPNLLCFINTTQHIEFAKENLVAEIRLIQFFFIRISMYNVPLCEVESQFGSYSTILLLYVYLFIMVLCSSIVTVTKKKNFFLSLLLSAYRYYFCS